MKLGYRDLLAVNAFNEIALRFDVVWLFSGEVPSLGIDSNATVKIITTNPLRYRSWLGLHSLVRYEFDNLILSALQKKPTLGFGRLDQVVLAAIIAPGCRILPGPERLEARLARPDPA